MNENYIKLNYNQKKSFLKLIEYAIDKGMLSISSLLKQLPKEISERAADFFEENKNVFTLEMFDGLLEKNYNNPEKIDILLGIDKITLLYDKNNGEKVKLKNIFSLNDPDEIRDVYKDIDGIDDNIIDYKQISRSNRFYIRLLNFLRNFIRDTEINRCAIRKFIEKYELQIRNNKWLLAMFLGGSRSPVLDYESFKMLQKINKETFNFPAFFGINLACNDIDKIILEFPEMFRSMLFEINCYHIYNWYSEYALYGKNTLRYIVSNENLINKVIPKNFDIFSIKIGNDIDLYDLLKNKSFEKFNDYMIDFFSNIGGISESIAEKNKILNANLVHNLFCKEIDILKSVFNSLKDEDVFNDIKCFFTDTLGRDYIDCSITNPFKWLGVALKYVKGNTIDFDLDIIKSMIKNNYIDHATRKNARRANRLNYIALLNKMKFKKDDYEKILLDPKEFSNLIGINDTKFSSELSLFRMTCYYDNVSCILSKRVIRDSSSLDAFKALNKMHSNFYKSLIDAASSSYTKSKIREIFITLNKLFFNKQSVSYELMNLCEKNKDLMKSLTSSKVGSKVIKSYVKISLA